MLQMSKEHEEYIKRVKNRELKIKITRILILIGFIILWEILAQFKK